MSERSKQSGSIACEFSGNEFCGFKFYNTYTCIIKSQGIPSNFKVTAVIGKHTRNDFLNRECGNNDVQALKFIDSKIARIPQGFINVFKNLNCITFNHCELPMIDKSDLQELPNLRYLDLSYNSLKFIPGDLFANNKLVRNISFANNKLSVISGELFDNFTGFLFADFRGNPGGGTWFDSQIHNFEKFKTNFKKMCNKLNAKSQIEAFSKIEALKNENQKIKVEYQKEVVALRKENKKLQDRNLKLQTLVESNIGALEDINSLLVDEKFNDFTFVIDDQEFKVQKFIFMARSKLFREMMLKNPDADRLILEDIPCALFTEILDFIYFKSPKEFDSDLLMVYAAASKLKIEKLRKLVAQKLIESLSVENAYECLLVCQKYNHKELKLKAFAEIKKEFGELPDELADDLDKLSKILEAKKLLEDASNCWKKSWKV